MKIAIVASAFVACFCARAGTPSTPPLTLLCEGEGYFYTAAEDAVRSNIQFVVTVKQDSRVLQVEDFYSGRGQLDETSTKFSAVVMLANSISIKGTDFDRAGFYVNRYSGEASMLVGNLTSPGQGWVLFTGKCSPKKKLF